MREWFRALRQHAAAIDKWYGETSSVLLDALATSNSWLLQSWFSSDWYGHLNGCGTKPYRDAVQQAFAHAASLHLGGYWVLVTSDHGGRATPVHLHFDRSHGVVVTPGGTRQLPLGAADWLLSGDHLVGYGASTGLPSAHQWVGSTLQPVVVPQSVFSDSFAQSQTPVFLILPADNERFSERPGQGGGDHGACASQGTLSPVDDVVPLVIVGIPHTVAAPTRLADVAGYFLRGGP